MSTDNEMRERHGRVLAELAETGMVMVRRLSQAMERTDDVQVQAQIGLAFHRVSRAVRQTMALEFRLSQEARCQDRGDPAPSPRPKPAASPAASPAESLEPVVPRPAAERTGWNEYERSDSDEALDALDELLDAEELDVETVHEALRASLDRLRRDFAADPFLAKAGLLEAAVASSGPQPRTRRSELMGAGAGVRPALPALQRAGAAPGPFAPPRWRGSG